MLKDDYYMNEDMLPHRASLMFSRILISLQFGVSEGLIGFISGSTLLSDASFLSIQH